MLRFGRVANAEWGIAMIRFAILACLLVLISQSAYGQKVEADAKAAARIARERLRADEKKRAIEAMRRATEEKKRALELELRALDRLKLMKRGFRPGGVRPVPPPTRASGSRRMPTARPVIRIPSGKFGLVLDDGSRVIGTPSRDWAATVTTAFGKVTIPLDQISRVVNSNAGVQISLTNGDRVSGAFVSRTMTFQTAFGALTVPQQSIIRMATGSFEP